MPQVNDRPLGENSPNLATLRGGLDRRLINFQKMCTVFTNVADLHIALETVPVTTWRRVTEVIPFARRADDLGSNPAWA
jgi:hypothetical protein